MKVSVILTSYNRPNGIREAFKSVVDQSYADWELFIVDDNSNDATIKVLNELAKSESRCSIIQSGISEEERPKTARYASCINLAIPYLTGEFVTYLTDDDIYYLDRFQVMVDLFKKNSEVFVVYGIQKVIEIHSEFFMSTYNREQLGITRTPACKIDHNSIMHRRCCFEIIEKWDDHPEIWGCADGVFFERLAEHWDFHPIEHLTDEHRIHAGGVQKRLMSGKNPWDS